MKRAMTVTYIVDGALYINVTNKCTNNCVFCIRNNDDGAYGSESLWLLHEPGTEEITDAVFSHNLSDFREIVFCGYGEPSMRLEVCREAALRIKEKHDIRIRMNTNGHSSAYFGYDTAPLYEGAFDAVSVSLNTPSREAYERLCRPHISNAYDALISFAGEVKKYVPEVKLSVVRQTLTEDELEECHAIARRVGVELRVRDLIS